MLLIALGVILWMAGHLWNRFLPGVYGSLGKAGYGISLVIIIGSIVLMVMGFKQAEYVHLWGTPLPMYFVATILVVFAFYTYFATATPKGTVWLVGDLRHPQLTGFKIWAVAHLIMNGNLESLILFGGLIAWAVLEVILINRQGEKFDRSNARIKTRWGHLALVAVALAVVSAVHIWVGPHPFGVWLP